MMRGRQGNKEILAQIKRGADAENENRRHDGINRKDALHVDCSSQVRLRIRRLSARNVVCRMAPCRATLDAQRAMRLTIQSDDIGRVPVKTHLQIAWAPLDFGAITPGRNTLYFPVFF